MSKDADDGLKCDGDHHGCTRFQAAALPFAAQLFPSAGFARTGPRGAKGAGGSAGQARRSAARGCRTRPGDRFGASLAGPMVPAPVARLRGPAAGPSARRRERPVRHSLGRCRSGSHRGASRALMGRPATGGLSPALLRRARRSGRRRQRSADCRRPCSGPDGRRPRKRNIRRRTGREPGGEHA